MGFKKGNQNIDSVFYGTDYVERMYLGKNKFFQASYLDFYKTNFFSIGLGQKRQIDRPGQAISLIKTEWSSQYGYQLEIKQDSEGLIDYQDSAFRDNFSFILPKGKYLVNAALKNMPTSTGELYCHLLKKGETPNQDVYLTSTFSDGRAKEVSVDEDTEVYLGMYIKDLNVGKTTIFSLELSPATGETGKFVEDLSLMVRGRKKEIYNAGTWIDIKIPETAFYDGQEYPVRYIDSDAFNYKVTENGTTETPQPLESISTIAVEGNNMIGFGNRAFQNCSNCMSFSCTSSVFQGGLFANNAAFEGCGALNSLTLSIVKNINGLKESKKLNSINMGGRNTYSFDDSFAGNTSIEKIHWKNKDEPSGIEKPFTAHFGISSFEGCKNLKTIVSNDYDVAEGTLGKDTVFIVDDAAFAYCTSLDTKGAGFGPNTGPLYSRLAYRAFFECTGLTSIDFGTKEGAETAIGSLAFENCTGLTSINLPNTVTSIWSKAFSGCSSLETINIPFIGESATSTNNKFNYIFGTVPASLTTVGFSEGNNITEIPDYAFDDCSGLTSITLPNSVTSIGDGALRGCSGLTNINIPNSVTSIGSYAFQGCSGLTNINIPDGVTSISYYAFGGCSGLTSITLPNSVTSIGSYAFQACSSLTSITIPNSVTSIGSYAFQGCSGLTNINIPNSVTSIGSYAFNECSSLETINIPFIGESATSTNNKFSYIFGTVPASLTTVNFSKGNEITKIPDYAFENCSNITSINNNDTENITSIGQYAYSGTGITSIRLSSALTAVGQNAFSGCTGLTSVRFEKTNNYNTRTIGVGAFTNCNNLTNVQVPGGFSNGPEGETGQWLSKEAAKNWAINDFTNIYSNPLSIAKTLQTTDASLQYTTVENFYFSSSDGYALTAYLCCYLQGKKLIVSFDSIGTQAFYNCSFDELLLNFKNVYTSAGQLAQKIYIGKQAFCGASFAENVKLDTTVSEKSAVPIVFGEDAFKNFKITNANHFFEFVPGKEYWGSCCYFYNADANPCYQEDVKLACFDTETSSIAKVTEGYFNTDLQQQASALGINIKMYGYQYAYAKDDQQNPITSLYVTGDFPWVAPDYCCLNCFGILQNFNLANTNKYVDYIGTQSFYKTGYTINTPYNILYLGGSKQKGLVIGYEAFTGCQGLSNITISNLRPFDGGYAIEYRAFAECSNLRNISLLSLSPKGDQTYARFERGIFDKCPSIEYIDTCCFSAQNSKLSASDSWQNSFFYLFNISANFFLIAAENHYPVRQASRGCYLPPNLKEFQLNVPSEGFYKQEWNYIGYQAANGSWAANNPDKVAPIFKTGGITGIRVETGQVFGNYAFESNNGTITKKY